MVTPKAAKQYSNDIKILKENNLQTKILYPTK